ncbi:hypothetical protein CAEBREN_00119 [Caenorhabditis brenneri]|uniref:Uncharacterized protein n=1 Tax=Caenorhabditis brenneri TaxID=135651 RepID=G0NLB9_CAEBE|nr:hypothetical protein CAEBREN_00119 [Caenorhabditis brenneri]
MQPIPLYPIFAGYTVGILASWLDISTHYSMILFMFFAVISLECLVICFERKHQSLAVILNVHVLPKTVVYGADIFCVICPFVLCFWFDLEHLTEQEQWDHIKKNHPDYVDSFRSIKHFDIYIRTLSMVICMICTLLGGFILFFLFLFYIIDLFRIMYLLKPRISNLNYDKHADAIKSLVVEEKAVVPRSARAVSSIMF